MVIDDAEAPGFLANRDWVDFPDATAFAHSLDELVFGITGRKRRYRRPPLQTEFDRAFAGVVMPDDIVRRMPSGLSSAFQPAIKYAAVGRLRASPTLARPTSKRTNCFEKPVVTVSRTQARRCNGSSYIPIRINIPAINANAAIKTPGIGKAAKPAMPVRISQIANRSIPALRVSRTAIRASLQTRYEAYTGASTSF